MAKLNGFILLETTYRSTTTSQGNTFLRFDSNNG